MKTSLLFLPVIVSLVTAQLAAAGEVRTLVESEIGKILVMDQNGRLLYLKEVHGRTESLGKGKTFDRESIERLEKRIQESKALGRGIITSDAYLVFQQISLIALAGAIYFFEPVVHSTPLSIATLLSSPYLALACESYGLISSDIKSNVKYALRRSRAGHNCRYVVTGPKFLQIAKELDSFLKVF